MRARSWGGLYLPRQTMLQRAYGPILSVVPILPPARHWPLLAVIVHRCPGPVIQCPDKSLHFQNFDPPPFPFIFSAE